MTTATITASAPINLISSSRPTETEISVGVSLSLSHSALLNKSQMSAGTTSPFLNLQKWGCLSLTMGAWYSKKSLYG